MKIGATFPHGDIGADRDAIRRYCEAVVYLGYDYLLAYDHVLGADVTNRPGWTGYTIDDRFHEIFTLLGYAAAIAPELELVTSVVILPQRQTVLVAKQAAEIDILTAGKFRLGVGIGWNAVEYEALGEDFTNRGKRSEEQIEVMRRLWREPVLSYQGRWHTITEAGLTVMPIQQPIPIWLGGTAEVALDRAARLADGWFPIGVVDDAQRERLRILRDRAESCGRDPSEIGIDARIDTFRSREENWERNIELWREAGATHLCVNEMYQERDIDSHIAALERFMKVASGYR